MGTMRIRTGLRAAAGVCLAVGGLLAGAGAATADAPAPTSSPSPSAVTTDYVHYPWSSAIYAVTSGPDGSQWRELTGPQWTAAGSPAPRPVGWIDGSHVTRFDTSAEIVLTDPDGVVHPLSYAEWLAAGSPAPQQMTNQGYLKLSWSPQVFAMTDLTVGTGHPLSAAEWVAAGRPTPRVVPWIAGESWERAAGSSTIFYTGPGVHEAVTAQEWTAAGRPAPHVSGAAPAVASSALGASGASGDRATYVNSDGVQVHSPVAAPAAPPGATAQCKDGSYSSSLHHSGTCSHHGGVAHWL